MNLHDAENGKHVSGRRELIKHLKGERISRGEALRAKCYECNGGYPDGAFDCEIEGCPLYPFNPKGPMSGAIKKGKSKEASKNDSLLL